MYYVFLANGFEQVEALAPVDIMRRAEIEVYTVGVGAKVITSSHNVPVVADVIDCEIAPDKDCEGIILPGGMPGTLNLEKSATVQRFIDYCVDNKLLIAAICAAPSILGHKGLLSGKKAVCFPGFEEYLYGAKVDLSRDVVRDGKFITSRCMGTALPFAFELVECLLGREKRDSVERAVKAL